MVSENNQMFQNDTLIQGQILSHEPTDLKPQLMEKVHSRSQTKQSSLCYLKRCSKCPGNHKRSSQNLSSKRISVCTDVCLQGYLCMSTVLYFVRFYGNLIYSITVQVYDQWQILVLFLPFFLYLVERRLGVRQVKDPFYHGQYPTHSEINAGKNNFVP